MSSTTSPPNAQDLQLIASHLLGHHALDAADLVAQHPPQFHNRNKRAVYQLMCPQGAQSHHGTLAYTRWKQLPLPATIPAAQAHTDVVDGFFAYAPPPAGEAHWHVNFADSNVFAFYGGRLFAQDELQCLEHPALCSLRELLVSLPAPPSSLLDPTRTAIRLPEATLATPVLVSGVERRAHVHTDRNAPAGRPHGLYGNAFGGADESAVRRAVEVLDTRRDAQGRAYFTNILAITAPRGTSYSRDVVRQTLATAYTGFVAARLEALVAAGFLVRARAGGHSALADPMPSRPAPRVKIHTGNWGCGAFGGNPVVMSMLQTVAARMAGVDLVYYVQGADNRREYDSGMEDLRDLTAGLAKDGSVDLEAFLDAAVEKGYMWGVSNGT